MEKFATIRTILGYSIVGLSVLCCMILIVLKLAVVIVWSWSVVFLPLLIPIICVAAICLGVFGSLGFAIVLDILCGEK